MANDSRFGVEGRPEGRHHLAHIGVLGEHHPVEGSPNDRVFNEHRGSTQGRFQRSDAGFRRINRRPGSGILILSGFEISLRHDLLIPQVAVAPEVPCRCVPFGFRLDQIGSGRRQLGRNLSVFRLEVIIVQFGKDIPILYLTALLNGEEFETSRSFGGHRRTSLRHHIAAGIEIRKGL